MSSFDSAATGFLCDEVADVMPGSSVDQIGQAAPVAPAEQAAPVSSDFAKPALYGDKRSGNCLKVSFLMEYLGLDVKWQDVDLLEGETLEPEFLDLNAFGKLPALRLASGQVIAESNAILLELSLGSDLEPQSDAARAEIFQWLFWEASAFTPPIAQRRWCVTFVNKADEDIDPKLLPKGNIVLARLEEHLCTRTYVAGDRLSIADFSLFGYGHAIEEGGWHFKDYPAVAAWVTRVRSDIKRGTTSWQSSQEQNPSQQIAS